MVGGVSLCGVGKEITAVQGANVFSFSFSYLWCFFVVVVCVCWLCFVFFFGGGGQLANMNTCIWSETWCFSGCLFLTRTCNGLLDENVTLRRIPL